MTATRPEHLDLLAPGARVIVRDLVWQVDDVERQGIGTRAIVRCTGRSELVRDQPAAFFTDIDEVIPEDPERTRFRLDESPHGIETRLVIESLLRRTPVPVSETDVLVGHRMLADDLPFQREPFRKAMEQLQPRLLIADAVGLGKTLEVGIILSELQRRGRANRVLAVVPRHILDQVQHELWTRFAFPLVRLDSSGIQRLRQRIPAGRNPFTYYERAIVSIDTLKQPGRYRHHLEKVRWDVVWIDESHKLVNKSTLNNQLAQVLAPNADALILSSATPHNGKAESFAELVSLLDPTAVTDPSQVTAEDIEHLVVRRHKHSPDVKDAIGDRWAKRKEPEVVPIEPSEREERIFQALAERWLPSEDRRAAGASSVASDTLFPYTLLKAALSSPKALSDTVENRLRPKRLKAIQRGDATEITPEEEALYELWTLAEEALTSGSAKLDAIVDTLRDIGVGPGSETRAVIFSERIATLDWIAHAIRDQLGMSDEQVVTFHNSKSDEEQQRVVEDFSMASAPVRVLVTSDIASEGVNLHKQCHHLIHADLPWSLITTTQRNGRIDRYGQLHPPEIRYLVYDPRSSEEIASDVRILTKLVQKEHEAHKALGDAVSVMGLHSETAEEGEIRKILRERSEEAKADALEGVAPTPDAWNPWSFAGLATPGDPVPENRPKAAQVGALPTLFRDAQDFLVSGLDRVYDNLADLDWEADGDVFSFVPRADLLRRLESLPQSYLKQRDLATRLRLTTNVDVADQSLRDALNAHADGGTAWPEIHYLGPQHPVLDWIADKLLYLLDRDEALALAVDVERPTVLISGTWANRMGEPIADAWIGATVEDGIPTFEQMTDLLDHVGVRDGMVNAGKNADLTAVEELLPSVIAAARQNLKDRLDDQVASVQQRLDQRKTQLAAWQLEARAIAQNKPPSPKRTARLDAIERITRQIDHLIDSQRPTERPLIRIVGALVPKG